MSLQTSHFTANGISVRILDLSQANGQFAARWLELEKRSAEGNAFLSPHFVLPAIEHLVDDAPLIVVIEDQRADQQLIGLGVFKETNANRQLLLKHLQAWRCDYSLFVGLLIDDELQGEALNAFFAWLHENSDRWHGLAMRDQGMGTPFADAMISAAAEHGLTWSEDWVTERAAIKVDEIPDDVMSIYSKTRRKSIRKSIKRLKKFGQVSFELKKQGKGFEESLATFLRLESMGWKGGEGTAMNSQPNHLRFGQEMAAGFAADERLVIGELKVDDDVIASTLNLISGDTLFALKIGWDPRFTEASPGAQSEFYLLKNVAAVDGVAYVDSCAKMGSYVENQWPWRK